METQTFDRDQIREAARGNEVLVEVNHAFRFIEPETIYNDANGALFASLDDEEFEVLALARDLNSVIPDLPQITVALLGPDEVECYWDDPNLHIMIADGVVLGPLHADGRSRPLPGAMTITQEEDGMWVMRSPGFWRMLDIRR